MSQCIYPFYAFLNQQWFGMFPLIKSTWINIIFETAPLAGGWLSPGWGKYYPIWDTAYSYFEKGCQKKVHVTILKGNMGYNQYTVPDTEAVEDTFDALL